MLQLAVSSGYFRRCTAGKPSKRKRELVMLRSTAKAPTLLTVYATCIYLALKVCDRVPHVSMLSAMLSYVLHDRVDPAQVGAWALVRVRWDLSQAPGADAHVWQRGIVSADRHLNTFPISHPHGRHTGGPAGVAVPGRAPMAPGPVLCRAAAGAETGPQNAEAPPAPDS